MDTPYLSDQFIDKATAAYNEVWNAASNITPATVDVIRREAIKAALLAIHPQRIETVVDQIALFKDLAERCQIAEEPDPKLGAEILRACGWEVPDPLPAHKDPTQSADAAINLVPFGCVYSIKTDFELPGRGHVYGWPGDDASFPPVVSTKDASSGPYALCAAIFDVYRQVAERSHGTAST